MKYIIVIFLTLLLTNFYGATPIPDVPEKILMLILLPFVVFELNNKSMFKPYIIALIVFLIINFLTTYAFRGQSIWLTFQVSQSFFFILFYFMLKSINPSLPEMEKALNWLIAIFCLSYLIQFVIYPLKLFITPYWSAGDGIRFTLIGQAFASLGYFYGLNKFLTDNKKLYLLLSILCFSVIFLMGFRSLLAGVAIATLIMTIRIYGFSLKLFLYGILAAGIFIAIIQLPVFAEKINSMLARQETQNLNNSDYIRVIAFQFFTEVHFTNSLEYILGSGLPFPGTEYGNYMTELTEQGLYYADWGLLGLSWMIGIPPVVVMIVYSTKMFVTKVDKKYCYIGIWFFYLVIASVTTMEFYRLGNFVVQAIGLFMFEKVVNNSSVVLPTHSKERRVLFNYI